MRFERIAEMKIREAIDAGEFERLPNAGSRLDLEPYFAIPAHLRMAYSILQSANCLPKEVYLLNDVVRLENELARAADASLEGRLSKDLQDARLRLAVALERMGGGGQARPRR